MQSKYLVPNTIYTSREKSVLGWNTIENSSWIVSAEGRGDPEKVKEQMLNRAKSIGANAVIEIKYEKKRGSESSYNGKGWHYYTIHCFSGRAITIGKLSEKGTETEESLTKINRLASLLKIVLNEKYKKSQKTCFVVWLISLLFFWLMWKQKDFLLSLGSVFTYIVSNNETITVIFGIILLVAFIPENKGKWLNRG